VAWTAGTCFDVRREGPYEPGVRVLALERPSSIDGEPRVLETAVWYPAPAGSGERESEYRAIPDAPIDRSAGRHPIVLFSHGSCGFERQSLFLTPWLASHGFVVVAPPHPGNTLFEFPDCGTPSAQGRAAVERPDDMIFVLDQILAENADPASPFSDALDPSSIAMTGHSFGGFTTFLVAERDPRIKAAIPMAAATGNEFRLDVPSLTLIGEVDSVVSNPGNVAAFDRSVTPKWLVSIQNTGHYAFSDGCFPSPDCEPPSVLEQDEAHDLVKRWVLPFLKVFIEDDLAFAPFLAEEAGPAFDVEAD
jgi:predicted dienelactone hydrolase